MSEIDFVADSPSLDELEMCVDDTEPDAVASYNPPTPPRLIATRPARLSVTREGLELLTPEPYPVNSGRHDFQVVL